MSDNVTAARKKFLHRAVQVRPAALERLERLNTFWGNIARGTAPQFWVPRVIEGERGAARVVVCGSNAEGHAQAALLDPSDLVLKGSGDGP